MAKKYVKKTPREHKYGCRICADKDDGKRGCKRKNCLYADILDQYESYNDYDEKKQREGFSFDYVSAIVNCSVPKSILKAAGIK